MSSDASSPISQITQALSGVLTLPSQPSQSTSEPNPPEDATGSQPTELAREDDDSEVPRTPLPVLSHFSTPALGSAAWAAEDFLVGAGMVIFQRNTHKIVLVYETAKDYWFFPRGRKDIGETIEEAAFREAYEESGFRPQPLPLLTPTRQPSSPPSRVRPSVPNTEPVFMTMTTWRSRRGSGCQYLTTWFAGQIDEDAVAETGTGMPDEQNFQSHLLTIDEAMGRVWGSEIAVLRYVWEIYCYTLKVQEEARRARRLARQQANDDGLTFPTRRSVSDIPVFVL